MRPITPADASMGAAIVAAEATLDEDRAPAFIHLHTKATDEAGHTKDPRYKVEVIEALDAELAGLLDLVGRAVIAVTGDHATPSVTALLHSGDPTPLVVVGPDTRADRVTQFGEEMCTYGALARISAVEILPLLLGEARRPAFIGHRAGARRTTAQPLRPAPMPTPAHGL
jgi:2,3-bisphosphoglycerate-independent phosphoglycerate mutase